MIHELTDEGNEKVNRYGSVGGYFRSFLGMRQGGKIFSDTQVCDIFPRWGNLFPDASEWKKLLPHVLYKIRKIPPTKRYIFTEVLAFEYERNILRADYVPLPSSLLRISCKRATDDWLR